MHQVRLLPQYVLQAELHVRRTLCDCKRALHCKAARPLLLEMLHVRHLRRRQVNLTMVYALRE